MAGLEEKSKNPAEESPDKLTGNDRLRWEKYQQALKILKQQPSVSE